ncbi:hypothetical protein [Pseudophaeobacter sp.]|uniref:hypothetical protein n=1 Tax=Pseudophaeobacter sp. TaxID=1971739 RepID=UPI003296C64A
MTLRDDLANQGRAWIRSALTHDELNQLRHLAELGQRPGARVPKPSPLFEALEQADFKAQLQASWPGTRPLRLLSFDKAGSVNWGLPWHQDRVISVAERHDRPGYLNWSQKAGVWHQFLRL